MKDFLNKIHNKDGIAGMKELYETQGKCVDLIMTSPPYYNSNKKYQRGSGVHYSYDIGEPLYTILDMFEEAKNVLKDDGFICINLAFSYGETGVMRPFYVLERAVKLGFFVVDTIIWRKTNPIPLHNRLTNAFEYIFVLAKHPFVKYPSSNRIGYTHNIIETSVTKPKEASFHSAVFPIEVPRFCIEIFSNENDIVLDPFIGSGTTALACMELEQKRNFIGFEINPDYCLKATERIENISFQNELNLEL